MFRSPCSYSAAAAFLAVALLTKPVDAQSKDINSANYVVPACKSFLAREVATTDNAFEQGRCAGMLRGLRYLAGDTPNNLRSCIPKGVTIGQLVRLVLAYVERRPQRMHEDFLDLALEAFHDAWPCKR